LIERRKKEIRILKKVEENQIGLLLVIRAAGLYTTSFLVGVEKLHAVIRYLNL